jgi:plastocyanin
MAYVKALLGTGLVDGAKNIGFNRDLPYLTEFFEDETIDAAVWDETTTNTGTITFTMEDGFKFVRLSTGATNVSTSVLSSDHRFEFRPNSFNLISNVITRIVLEWDMRFTNVANILNTSFIAGFANDKTSIRTSNNIAAICLNGDVITAITDNNGTEVLNNISAGITVTNWNKYRITAVPGNTVYFYINDTLVATHNVAANLPNNVMYIVFHNANDAAANANVDVAHIRQWYSE